VEILMPKVTLDTAVLETLREHAASAARLVSYLDDGVDSASAVGPLADHVDEIFHTLSEILGNPHLVAAPVSSACVTFTPDAYGVSEHASPERALADDATPRADVVALALDTSKAAS
jgi:hypothetical protein